MAGKPQAEVELLRADSLRVRYRSGALGILDVSIRVRPGEIVGLFGPNGAGKTTTVRAISGFLRSEDAKVTVGTVAFNNRDITNFEPHRVCALGVAVVPERRKIFHNLSVSENLEALGGRCPRAERKAVLDYVRELFPVLADRREEIAGRLSGGQQQMLAIGRALLLKPSLLIIDELTLGLHPSVHGELFSALSAIAKRGTAALIIDESTRAALEVVNYCYLLNAGGVHSEGTPEKFRGNELLVAGYVGL